MVHQLFDPASTRLAPRPQSGGGEFYTGRMFQRGRGLGGYAAGIHSGAGMGDVFRAVWRYLRPYAASAGRALASEGADTAQRILGNLAQGANLNETLKTEGKEGITRLLNRAGGPTAPAQSGRGIGGRKRRTRDVDEHRFHLNALRDKRAKRPRKDAFGFY
jgi:hypothetical protein